MLEHEPIFGKNVIETLSEGMYDNPLFLFREYVQNSADAIDSAVRQGVLKEGEGQIEIVIDVERRLISFEDNGIGIVHEDVKKMLANIGDSRKDRNTDKGFRGIGRLGGLGYCHQVRFETSARGEAIKSIFEWDAQKLHEILADKNEKMHAGQLIKWITRTREDACDPNEHFFKVSLIDINGTSDELLDVNEVRKYLSMVAPVPFDYERFRFVTEIESFLQKSGIPKPHEYRLSLNGDEVRKGYETPLKIDSEKGVDILDVVCRVITSSEGKALGWYWFCISKFEGVLPKKCWQRNIRLRKANIQIGEADCLSNHPKRGDTLWKEDRGNNYFIGEIHALDENLIPNSRRDYFNQDEACRRFESALLREFRVLHDLYHDASAVRSAAEKIKDAEEARKAFEKKVAAGAFYDKKDQDRAKQELEEVRQKASIAVRTIDKIKAKAEEGLFPDAGSEASPLAMIVKEYQPKEIVTSFSDMLPANRGAKKGFAKDNLNKGERRVLDVVFKVLEEKLPPDESAPIRDEILKRAARL